MTFVPGRSSSNGPIFGSYPASVRKLVIEDDIVRWKALEMAAGLLYLVPVYLSFLYFSQAGYGGRGEIRNTYEVLDSSRLRLHSYLHTMQMLRKCRELK